MRVVEPNIFRRPSCVAPVRLVVVEELEYPFAGVCLRVGEILYGQRKPSCGGAYCVGDLEVPAEAVAEV